MKQCKRCALNTTNGCLIFKHQVNPEDCCPKYTSELFTCDFCQRQIMPGDAILTQKPDGSWEILCRDCAQHDGMCPTCAYGTVCDFETNPINIPKLVQQGNMLVKNPSRIAETCRKNCPCFDQNLGCGKQNYICPNFQRR